MATKREVKKVLSETDELLEALDPKPKKKVVKKKVVKKKKVKKKKPVKKKAPKKKPTKRKIARKKPVKKKIIKKKQVKRKKPVKRKATKKRKVAKKKPAKKKVTKKTIKKKTPKRKPVRKKAKKHTSRKITRKSKPKKARSKRSAKRKKNTEKRISQIEKALFERDKIPKQRIKDGDRIKSMFCYIPVIGWIIALLVYVIERESHFVQYHAVQGIFLAIIIFVFSQIPYIESLASPLGILASVYMMIMAYRRKYSELPLIGWIAKKFM